MPTDVDQKINLVSPFLENICHQFPHLHIYIIKWKYRSSHRWCSLNKKFLKNFAIFIRKHLCWSCFLIKLQASRHATLLKRDSNTGVYLWILQTLRTPISKNIWERQLLIVVICCIENWIKLFRNQIGLLFLLKHKITLF